jgi:hypothetical protein
VLVAGMAAGASVGLLAGSAGEAAARDGAAEPAAEWTYLEDAPSSLAESYWSAVTGAELEEER